MCVRVKCVLSSHVCDSRTLHVCARACACVTCVFHVDLAHNMCVCVSVSADRDGPSGGPTHAHEGLQDPQVCVCACEGVAIHSSVCVCLCVCVCRYAQYLSSRGVSDGDYARLMGPAIDWMLKVTTQHTHTHTHTHTYPHKRTQSHTCIRTYTRDDDE